MSTTTGPATILIVEDEAGLRDGLVAAMETLGFVGLSAPSLAEARRLLATDSIRATIDCVLLDIRLRDGDGLSLLAELRQGPHRDIPVILATAYGDSERTIRAMRDGAFDYLTKPFDFPNLLATVSRAVKHRRLAQNLTAPERGEALGEGSGLGGRGGLIGASAAMLGIWKVIGRAAATDAPVLITGETGSGKELVARAIHAYSTRTAAPFLAVNLAALPPTLIESELFGHERGAFTGANARRSGRIETAAEGTLFLDEIGDLDATLQTKLLRVLADGAYERVGGEDRLLNRARIISATHKPVRPGEPGCVLRDDLYYRLAVIEIEVPPLRARRSDIPLLVAHALEGTPARAVSEEAMAHLLAYRWPGNVRELIHVIERAAALAGGEIIDVGNLPESLLDTPRVTNAFVAEAAKRESEDERVNLKDAVAALEARLIRRALVRAGGNRSEAARQLGIGRPQLYAKMQEHGIVDKDGESD